jgi:hypothetical protein
MGAWNTSPRKKRAPLAVRTCARPEPTGVLFANHVATPAPQSPPCATQWIYPSRFISSAQAFAILGAVQPLSLGPNDLLLEQVGILLRIGQRLIPDFLIQGIEGHV